MTTDLDEALALARSAAAEVAALLRAAEGRVGEIRTKSNLRDLVTEWDTRAEDLLRQRLGTSGFPILGEERGTSGGKPGGYQWLVDPIDGTVNFAHGIPLFSTSIALERDGVAVVGVVVAPALGWEFCAAAGRGAFLGDRRLVVSGVATLAEAVLATGFPSDRATSPRNNFAEWEHFQRRAGACRRFGAASLDLAMVARGWLDGYWERRLSPWDLAAGALLVQEAGGRVTNSEGGLFRSADGDAVASNGAIHDQIVAELAAVQAAADRGRDS